MRGLRSWLAGVGIGVPDDYFGGFVLAFYSYLSLSFGIPSFPCCMRSKVSECGNSHELEGRQQVLGRILAFLNLLRVDLHVCIFDSMKTIYSFFHCRQSCQNKLDATIVASGPTKTTRQYQTTLSIVTPFVR